MVLTNEDGNIPTEERGLEGNENDGNEELNKPKILDWSEVVKEALQELNEPKILDWSEAVKEAPQVDSNYCRLSEEENANHNNEDADNASDIKLTALKQLEQDIEMQRAGARVAQKPYGQKFQ